jgi:mannitol/fructose-specific phosphotransferase system IIA component (Ntr-type)
MNAFEPRRQDCVTIWNSLVSENIFLHIPLTDKDQVLCFIAESLARTGRIKSAEPVLAALKEREDVMSTGIGGGIGIPHAITPEADDVSILLLRLEKPIPFQALDGKPVDVVIALIVPEKDKSLHLMALSRLAGLCKKTGFLKSVRTSSDAQALWNEIKDTEEAGNLLKTSST